MSALPQNKYSLKSVHEEIDLFDRKLAHLLKFDTFSATEDREAAARKLATKREQLVRAAREMAGNGIEFDPADLPRSFRAAPASPEGAGEAAISGLTGASLDSPKGTRDSRRKKTKQVVASRAS
jgi:hypothetical protein